MITIAYYDWKTDEIRFRYKEVCGAFARSTGKPCKAKALTNGRCKLHGGLSTGPKTAAGKARALANLKQFRQE